MGFVIKSVKFDNLTIRKGRTEDGNIDFAKNIK